MSVLLISTEISCLILKFKNEIKLVSDLLDHSMIKTKPHKTFKNNKIRRLLKLLDLALRPITQYNNKC